MSLSGIRRGIAGTVLPIVIIVAGITSALLASDLQRMVHYAKLQRINTDKAQLIILAEIESQRFLTDISAALQQQTCADDLAICIAQLTFDQRRLDAPDDRLGVTLQFESCASMYGDWCASQPAMVGAFVINLHARTGHGAGIEWHRFAYVQLADSSASMQSAVSLRLIRGQIVEQL